MSDRKALSRSKETFDWCTVAVARVDIME